jgi:hypothetical protein
MAPLLARRSKGGIGAESEASPYRRARIVAGLPRDVRARSTVEKRETKNAAWSFRIGSCNVLVVIIPLE